MLLLFRDLCTSWPRLLILFPLTILRMWIYVQVLVMRARNRSLFKKKEKKNIQIQDDFLARRQKSRRCCWDNFLPLRHVDCICVAPVVSCCYPHIFSFLYFFPSIYFWFPGVSCAHEYVIAACIKRGRERELRKFPLNSCASHFLYKVASPWHGRFGFLIKTWPSFSLPSIVSGYFS